MLQVDPRRGARTSDEEEPGGADRELERRAHEQVERRHVRPARAEAEHAGDHTDAGERGEAGGRVVHLPLDIAAERRIVIHAVHSERRAERIGARHVRVDGSPAAPHQGRDAEDGEAERYLQRAGRQGEAEERAGDGGERAHNGERHGEAHARKAAPQQRGRRRERGGECEQQARGAHEIKMEGKEGADDRHEQHAAAHAGEHRHDAHGERDREQRNRPDPPVHR